MDDNALEPEEEELDDTAASDREDLEGLEGEAPKPDTDDDH